MRQVSHVRAVTADLSENLKPVNLAVHWQFDLSSGRPVHSGLSKHCVDSALQFTVKAFPFRTTLINQDGVWQVYEFCKKLEDLSNRESAFSHHDMLETITV